MGQITRKYNFQPGTRIQSAQVDEEFDQLVDAHNTNDNRLTAVEGSMATGASLAATNARVETLEANSATHTEVAQAITEAMLGNPPLGGVTPAMLARSVMTGIRAGKLYAYKNQGGF